MTATALQRSPLPSPPSDEEKVSYLGEHKRWPFVWLFLAQACLIFSFVMVMKKTPDTSLGLILLTVMLPPGVVNLWLRTRQRRVTLDGHEERVAAWPLSRDFFPSVDVFLPSCGEDLAVLANTYRHVKAMTWPGRLHVYALDDAADAGTRSLAERFGFTYLVRPNRPEWKKAGNLIHGFESSDAEFIAVFDADFVPRKDFLLEILPYMDEPTTGVVQTAQYFDSSKEQNEFARGAGALQELFFRHIQPSRDSCEAAICAGTNVVYRRAAVVAAGGFAKVPLGEDVHSGVKIWVANFRTRYLPLVLAKGLAPDDWKSLTNQQYRWCRSSMLLMRSGFFRDAPFSIAQRVCYWAAFLYYMASAATVLTGVLPTLVMVWMFPELVRPGNYVLMIPSIISTLFVFPRLARGWRPTIYRVCTINSFCHLLAVQDALRDRVQAWVPTGATKSVTSGVPQRIATMLRVWLVVVQGLLWGGIAYNARHFNVWTIWPCVTLACVQLAMLAPLMFRLDPALPKSTQPVRPARHALPRNRLIVLPGALATSGLRTSALAGAEV